MSDYWHKQGSEPLFPDLLWSRPENKQFAGKLLIIGGNAFGMAAPAEAYAASLSAGIGVAKVLLPESLHKTVGKVLDDVEFAPSNKSGGFSKNALGEWLNRAMWADAVILAGDTARNSETAMVMEEFTKKYSGKLAITQDCFDQFLVNPKPLFARPDTLIVASFAQLQKAWPKLVAGKSVLRFSMNLNEIVELLHECTVKSPVHIIVKHLDQIIVASGGQVSTTHKNEEIWRVKTCAQASVWWLQNPSKVFEALTISVF